MKCFKDYRIFKEYNHKTCGYRKNLIRGHIIRIDIDLDTFKLCKVKELQRCSNWKIDSTFTKYNIKTYYINIL